jgi:hypothetical protein
MAAQTFHSVAPDTADFTAAESVVALWALVDVLDELPGSPEAQTDLEQAREKLSREMRALGISQEDLRDHARGLLARMGTVLPPARPPDLQLAPLDDAHLSERTLGGRPPAPVDDSRWPVSRPFSRWPTFAEARTVEDKRDEPCGDKAG